MLRAVLFLALVVACCFAGDAFFEDVTPLDGTSCGTTGFVTVLGNFTYYEDDTDDWGNSGSEADVICIGNFITNTTSVTSFTYYLSNDYDGFDEQTAHIPTPSYGLIIDIFNDPSSPVAITLLPDSQLLAANRTSLPNFAAVTANFGSAQALTASHVYILLFCANGTGNVYDTVFTFLTADNHYETFAGASCSENTAHQCTYSDFLDDGGDTTLATSIVCTGTATSAPVTTATTASATTATGATATTATTTGGSNTSTGSPASTLSVWWKFW